MLQHYKEIIFGLLFGLGAAVIDTFIDARMSGNSLPDELIQHPIMLLYRTLFVLFGATLGWLLWQKSKRERDFRNLCQTLARFHRELERHAFLMNAKLQVLMTREDLHLSREAGELIGYVYQSSQELQILAREKLPLVPPNI